MASARARQDWDARSRLGAATAVYRTADDDSRVKLHDFLGQRRKLLNVKFCETPREVKVAPVFPAQFAQRF